MNNVIMRDLPDRNVGAHTVCRSSLKRLIRCVLMGAVLYVVYSYASAAEAQLQCLLHVVSTMCTVEFVSSGLHWLLAVASACIVLVVEAIAVWVTDLTAKSVEKTAYASSQAVYNHWGGVLTTIAGFLSVGFITNYFGPSFSLAGLIATFTGNSIQQQTVVPGPVQSMTWKDFFSFLEVATPVLLVLLQSVHCIIGRLLHTAKDCTKTAVAVGQQCLVPSWQLKGYVVFQAVSLTVQVVLDFLQLLKDCTPTFFTPPEAAPEDATEIVSPDDNEESKEAQMIVQFLKECYACLCDKKTRNDPLTTEQSNLLVFFETVDKSKPPPGDSEVLTWDQCARLQLSAILVGCPWGQGAAENSDASLMQICHPDSDYDLTSKKAPIFHDSDGTYCEYRYNTWQRCIKFGYNVPLLAKNAMNSIRVDKDINVQATNWASLEVFQLHLAWLALARCQRRLSNFAKLVIGFLLPAFCALVYVAIATTASPGQPSPTPSVSPAQPSPTPSVSPGQTSSTPPAPTPPAPTPPAPTPPAPPPSTPPPPAVPYSKTCTLLGHFIGPAYCEGFMQQNLYTHWLSKLTEVEQQGILKQYAQSQTLAYRITNSKLVQKVMQNHNLGKTDGDKHTDKPEAQPRDKPEAQPTARPEAKPAQAVNATDFQTLVHPLKCQKETLWLSPVVQNGCIGGGVMVLLLITRHISCIFGNGQ